ncbi:unnamed protein product [Linum tenue]|uniref:Uncharacterized protein n=1 Tax=Linum tenue TaxID=586396 RepID=A0AAV0NSV3_9ROSI|nr:unnamed protein product [Linum tenue]
MEPRGRRKAPAPRREARPAELVADQQVDPRPIGEILPTPVVQSALAAGRAPRLHRGGGRDDRPRARSVREQVGDDRPPPPGPHRQRHQEPLELHAQEEVLLLFLRVGRRGGRVRW